MFSLMFHLPSDILYCFLICFAAWLNVFGQDIFILDKFWFRRSTQNTFKSLVWHLLHQNILNVNDFMKFYEKLLIFIKSLIFNIFWWKRCLTIGLKVFWVDLWNQNLSKRNISCIKIFESDIYRSIIKENMTGSMRVLLPHHKTRGFSLMF